MVQAVYETEVSTKEAERFVLRSLKAVNSLETACDRAWAVVNASFDEVTAKAQKEIQLAVQQLPKVSKDSELIDLTSPLGRQARKTLFRKLSVIYRKWEAELLQRLDVMKWSSDWRSWEKSLGMAPHRPGELLTRIRGAVLTSVSQMSVAHEKATPVEESLEEVRARRIEEIEEARGGDARGLGKGARSGKVGRLKVKLPKGGKITFKELRSNLKELSSNVKGSIDNAEKAWFENFLKGVDALARQHANEMFDVASNNTTAGALLDSANKFSAGKLSKKQLKLSVQTHMRSMARQIMTSPKFQKKLSNALDKDAKFIQLPGTRNKDLVSVPPSVRKRAFTVQTLSQIMAENGGMADSLGAYAGDKVQLIPVPKGQADSIAGVAAKLRDKWAKSLRAKGK